MIECLAERVVLSLGNSCAPMTFVFRPLTHADLPMLCDWLNRPHVAEWWEGPVSIERVQNDYGADIASAVVRPFIVELDGVPVGFIQVYDVMQADPEWWQDETDPGARGIDQFLADATLLGRGIGSRMVAAFVSYLFSDPKVTKVQTDPAPDNRRAVRAYEKAGFKAVRELNTPDGPALLMIIERAQRDNNG